MSGDDARRAMLDAIHASTEGVRDDDPAAAHAALTRPYRQVGERDAAARLDLFEERLVDYGVDVSRLRAGDVASAIDEELARRRASKVVVPLGFPEAYGVGIGARERLADDASARELDAADATVSTCAVAIAETGTIALDAGAGQGRRAASLVPDVHLCIVHASQVVATVPEATTRLEAAVQAGAPITWISGPSATSDIELVRVAGVHGPRTLLVLLVTDA